MSSSIEVHRVFESMAGGMSATGADPNSELGSPRCLSLSHQLANHRSIQVWLRESLNDSPSWLVSLILHLVAFLVVTSVAVPWAPASDSGSGTISLTLGFSERTQQPQGPEVMIKSTEGSKESVEADSDSEGRRPLSDDRAASAQHQQATGAQRAASAAPTTNRQSEASLNDHARSSDSPSYRVSRYAALLNRRRPSIGASISNTLTVTPLTELALDPQRRAMDQIVDDFIAYDVGQLRGAAGRRARERFARLGPESLPALVHGLNKAAGIHASCPVGIIAGKLITMLRNVNDPSLREYAIRHVGQGVPEDAPHFQGLVALRKNWLGAPSMPQNVAVIIDRLEAQQEGELMELMLALSGAPSDTVVAALRSDDEYLGAAATLAIIQGPHLWDSEQRGKLRAAMTHFQSNVKNPQIRALAADAQRVLTR